MTVHKNTTFSQHIIFPMMSQAFHFVHFVCARKFMHTNTVGNFSQTKLNEWSCEACSRHTEFKTCHFQELKLVYKSL